VSATSTWRPSEARSGGAGSTLAFARSWVSFAVGLGALAAGVWWATNSQIFDVSDIHVSGNHELSSQEIAGAAGLTSGTNLLWMSTGGVEKTLERNPWIREATVSRTPPSVVEIAVVERTAVAVLTPGSFLVAGDGTVLGKAPRQSTLLRLLAPDVEAKIGGLVSPDLPQLVALRQMPADLLMAIRQVGPGPGGTLAVRTRDGVRVLFGDMSDASQKWEALRGVLGWTARTGVNPLYIDVRSPIAPALRPRGTSADPVEQG
jgi:hypothetical protein